MQHDPSGTDTAGSTRRRRALAAGLTLALVGGGLVAAAVTRVGPFGGTGGGSGPDVPRPGTSSVAYTSFPDCSALLAYLKKHGGDLVGPYGMPGSGGPELADLVMTRGAGQPEAADAAPDTAAAPDTTSDTGTNVQVAGVDEADLAKRVGDLVYSVAPSGRATAGVSAGPALTVIRTAGGTVTPLGRLTLDGWQPSSLLVSGERGVLVGPESGRGVPFAERGGIVDGPAGPAWVPRTRLVEVDLTDPARPRQVRTLVVDGSVVGVRLVDDVARVAVSGATYRLRFTQPFADRGEPDVATGDGYSPAVPDRQVGERELRSLERRAERKNRKVVADSDVEDWLPTFALTEGTGTEPTRSGQLLSCQDVSAPSAFSGLDTLSLLAFDLGDPAGLSHWSGAGVVASGAQLYATADHTYVATSPWQDWVTLSGDAAGAREAMKRQRTQLHLFDTTGGASPVYVASGSVPGFLLNQFSMDEYGGHLRVASTSTPPWWGSTEDTASTSQVTVLRADGDELTAVGSVGGLGRTETIRSVRFLGDVGYVVTFRQTDPLYTVDLSDPDRPRVAGELKIRGYSAYLHPLGEGLLLGVGQDATEAGRTTGLQLSLFDVSDPAAPRRVDRVTLPGAWSDVEGDHHAFTYGDGMALVPFTRWSRTFEETDTEGYDAGVVAVRLTGDGTAGRFADPVVLRPVGDGPQTPDPDRPFAPSTPLRTFVGDGSVWTLTTGGMSAHDATTLRRTDYAEF